MENVTIRRPGPEDMEEIAAFYRDMGIRHIYTSVRWDFTDLLSFCKSLGFDRSPFINLRRVLE